MADITTQHYRKRAKIALHDDVLKRALSGVQGRLGPSTAALYTAIAEGLGARRQAHDIRMRSVENLDLLLEALADRIEASGGRVFFARDSVAAVNYCLEVADRLKVRSVVKGKSMVTEEIGLNPALEEVGVEVTETDLGEYIVQLAGEHPSHIIAPAIHKTRKEVGQLFAERLGIPYTDDPPTLTQAARKALRQKFLAADMGISGCNLACAETGHITTVSNEGNIRMSTTLPKVHVAFMGMERVVARLSDHDLLFRLLAHGAAAQRMAGYVSYIGGPRGPGQLDGPDEFHLVILDNGRSRILADPIFREVLCCIRCAACLNVCPVYGRIGGHSYGYPYSGPIGAVVTPLLTGIDRGRDLFYGETLCGACREACPVDIDLPRMLLALRHIQAEGNPDWRPGPESVMKQGAFRLWSTAVRYPTMYDRLLTAAKAGRVLAGGRGRIRRLPPPFSGWTRSRDVRPLAAKRFQELWKEGRV